MNFKNAYRVTFAMYLALFLWLSWACWNQSQWPGFALSAMLATSAGVMTWAAVFRPRH